MIAYLPLGDKLHLSSLGLDSSSPQQVSPKETRPSPSWASECHYRASRMCDDLLSAHLMSSRAKLLPALVIVGIAQLGLSRRKLTISPKLKIGLYRAKQPHMAKGPAEESTSPWKCQIVRLAEN